MTGIRVSATKYMIIIQEKKLSVQNLNSQFVTHLGHLKCGLETNYGDLNGICFLIKREYSF